MCKSVPQIEAVFTRTSTSVGPIAGTATVSISRPRAACIFRNAFIVVAILLSCPCRACLLRRAALVVAGLLDRSAVPQFGVSAAVQLSSTIPDASTPVAQTSVCALVPISPPPPPQSSRAPSNTPPPIPTEPARIPPRQHSIFLFGYASHQRNLEFHTHTLRRHPTIPHSSGA